MANSSWNKSSNDKVAEFVKASHIQQKLTTYTIRADHQIFHIHESSLTSEDGQKIDQGVKDNIILILPFINIQPREHSWIRSGINTTVFISSKDFIINQEQQII